MTRKVVIIYVCGALLNSCEMVLGTRYRNREKKLVNSYMVADVLKFSEEASVQCKGTCAPIASCFRNSDRKRLVLC